MAMNLRLDPELQELLASEARRTGRSQAQIIREAIDVYLSTSGRAAAKRERDALIAAGLLRPAAHRYRRMRPYLRITGELDRDDRL